MSDIVVQAERLSKVYQIGVAAPAHAGIRDAVTDFALAPFRRFRRLAGRFEARERFYALKDVSFEVARGEVLGVMGRNGAGKSTLLKVLSRITPPYSGVAIVRGRIGALLEVGTGFHSELTGRENIFLNGSILGMRSAEIREKFDTIVAFSGIGAFLDTPVKRYSSGMRVRLAFAVAAHLNSEILIVDEVLAVGDFEFQRRCLGKMGDVVRSGRTVLFVSHNLTAVRALCTRAILLEQGQVTYNGEVAGAIRKYQRSDSRTDSDIDLREHSARKRGLNRVLRRIRLMNPRGELLQGVDIGSDVVFVVDLESRTRLDGGILNVRIAGSFGDRLMTLNSRTQFPGSIVLHGPLQIRCTLHNLRLMPGRYPCSVDFKSAGKVVDEIDRAFCLEVVASDINKTGKLPSERAGFFAPETSWVVRGEQPSGSKPRGAGQGETGEAIE